MLYGVTYLIEGNGKDALVGSVINLEMNLLR